MLWPGAKDARGGANPARRQAVADPSIKGLRRPGLLPTRRKGARRAFHLEEKRDETDSTVRSTRRGPRVRPCQCRDDARLLWVFLSEVEFNNTAAIPEPGTYALMLAGLGAMMAVARWRRQAR